MKRKSVKLDEYKYETIVSTMISFFSSSSYVAITKVFIYKMKFTLLMVMFILTLTTAENSLARKKGNYGINGIIYKSGLMSLVTFLAIKAKVIIVLTVAFVIFVVGAKVWATFKYGNLLFNNGCHSYSHDGIVIPHPPTNYGHEFITSPEYEGFTPGYGYEKYSNGR